MDPAPRVPRLRWLLPITQLFLCAVILWPLRPMLAAQIRASLRSYGIGKDTAVYDPVVQGSHPLDLSSPVLQRRIKIAQTREWTVAALNMPGALPDLAHAILSPAHSEWTPRGMLMWTWRDLSWPIICIFFWWLAGRSIEALLSASNRVLLPKIRWWEIVVSLPVLAFGAICAVGVSIDQSSHTELPFWKLLLVFGGLWFILGLFTPAAFVVQWHLRKRLTYTPAKSPEGATA
jgi:hypothetical protein